MRWRKREAELNEEMRHHLESLAGEYRDRGLSPDEADAAARRDFGGVLRAQELYREQRGIRWLDMTWRDLRHALRSIRHSPVLALAVIATLALGIGANTAIFSVVRVVQLKPLPFPEADRLVWLTEYDRRVNFEGAPVAEAKLWAERSTTLDLAMVYTMDRPIANGMSARTARVLYTSQPLTKLLGFQLSLGRDFLPEELTPPTSQSSRNVGLISQRLFREEFGESPSVLGATISKDGQAITVIGVLSEVFRLPLPPPDGRGLQTEPDLIINTGAGLTPTRVSLIGRLRPDATLGAAQGEILSIRRERGNDKSRELRVIPLQSYITGKTRQEILILWCSVGAVLLIACVNVANLLLSRSVVRSREMAVRAALGAGRFALLRQTLAETTLLAFVGGALGLLLARIAIPFFAGYGPAGMPRLRDIAMDWTVVAYCAACCVFAGIVSGLPPAWSAMRTGLLEVLRRGGESTSSASLSVRVWHASLVVSQLVLALVLLSGAGLLIKSMWLMRSASASAHPEQVLIANLQSIRLFSGKQTESSETSKTVSPMQYMARIAEEVDAIAEQTRALPGVSKVGIEGIAGTIGVGAYLQGFPTNQHAPATVALSLINDDYFAAVGYRLIAGRLFSNERKQGLPRTAIVNRAWLDLFSPDLTHPQLAVNRQIFFERSQRNQAMFEIVGVVDNITIRPNSLPEPQIFSPRDQSTPLNSQLLVRTHGDPLAIRARLQRIANDNLHRLVNAETLEDRLTSAVATRSFESRLLGTFAGLALLLAVVGIYGVLNYATSQRTHEIGVRMALGASRSDILHNSLWIGLKLAIAGVVIGLIIALALARLMQSMLTGVTPLDPLTHAAAASLLLFAAVLAAWLPARRASRVDPMVALRHE